MVCAIHYYRHIGCKQSEKNGIYITPVCTKDCKESEDGPFVIRWCTVDCKESMNMGHNVILKCVYYIL